MSPQKLLRWFWKSSWRRRACWIFLALGSASLIGLFSAERKLLSATDRIHTPQSAPYQAVALVLGCSPTLRDGRENLFFKYRMESAAALFHAGRVHTLLLSGDNSRADYNEPGRMREALLQKGVPSNRMVLDYAGFSTFDSIARARDVFGCRQLTLISQKDHVLRALYIADALGLEAIGVEARDVGLQAGWKTKTRESLARVGTVLDLHLLGRKPKFLGPKIEIPTHPEP
jgi:SanA protein